MSSKIGTGARLTAMEGGTKHEAGDETALHDVVASHTELELRVATLENEFAALKAVFAPTAKPAV